MVAPGRGRDQETVKVVLFGCGRFASLAWYAVTHDSEMQPVAFAVDAAHRTLDDLHGCPVVPFETIAETYPPGEHRMLVSLGYRDRNRLRAKRFRAAEAAGYRCATWISSGAFRWPDLRIGANCMVFEQAILQPFVEIGDNVIIRSGANVSHHCRLADHVYVAPGAILAGGVVVGERAFVGAGAVVRDNVTLAEGTVVGAGAVVLEDTAPEGVYVGNPARRVAASETVG